MNIEGITKSITAKIIDPLIDVVIRCHVNRTDVREDLKNIILKIDKILKKEEVEVCNDIEYEEVRIMLVSLVEKLKQELKLYFRKMKNKNSCAQLLKILEDIDFSFQARCDKETLKKHLQDLRIIKHAIHFLHPLPHIIIESTPGKLISFGAILSFCIVGFSLVACDKLEVDSIRKNCKEVPAYRSNEWLASFLPPYKYLVEESYLIAGNTCISTSKKGKNQYYNNLAEEIFRKLRNSINPKSIPAAFFLDYLENPSSPDYKRSIDLIQDYIDDQSNYVLKKEDFDVAVKIAHVLEGNQKYDKANELYKIILHKDEDHVNALLGICSTHFTLESQADKVNGILKKCKRSIELLDKEKVIEKDNKRQKQAIAHHNYGCMLLRFEDYSEAKEQFKLGNEKDTNNNNIKKARAFLMIFTGKYEDAKNFITDKLKSQKNSVPSEFYKDTSEFQQDMRVGLGLAYLGMAGRSENDKKKGIYYKKAYENIDSSNDVTIKNMYLKKIEICMNNSQKECLASFPSKKAKENNLLFNHLHGKVLAFINHYQMDPNIADSPIQFPSKDDEDLKQNACTILKKPS